MNMSTDYEYCEKMEAQVNKFPKITPFENQRGDRSFRQGSFSWLILKGFSVKNLTSVRDGDFQYMNHSHGGMRMFSRYLNV